MAVVENSMTIKIELSYMLAFCHCDKIAQINVFKKKRLFWFTVSEVSFHGHLACGSDTAHRGSRRVCWSKCVPHKLPGSREQGS